MKLKKMISLVSLMALVSSAHASLIFPEKGLPTASQLRLTKVEKKIESHNNNGFRTMNIKIFGTATFSNACMAPDTIVKEIREREQNHISIRVLSVMNQDKVCPMIYKPIKKTFLIDTIGTTDIMPVIEVNGETL